MKKFLGLGLVGLLSVPYVAWCLIILLLLATPAFAAPSKVGFKAYSSATPVTCTAVSGTWGNTASMGVVPLFNPTISTARTYNLGTKGMSNYSTSGASQKVVYFNCGNTSDMQTSVYAKIYYDGVTTQYFPASSMFLFIKQ